MRDLTQQEIDQLEALIDTTGLSSVLMAISSICGSKSEHIAANRQDTALAKDWATAGGRIGVIVPSIAARSL